MVSSARTSEVAKKSASLYPRDPALQRILVPLDGSRLAEGILPLVSELAKGLGSRVELLSIIDQDILAPPARRFVDEVATSAMNEAERYLRDVTSAIEVPATRVRRLTTVGRAAASIVEEAEREPDTLIAMSTHGRSGVGRFVMGSVADKVLHRTRTPLLMFRHGPKTVEGQLKTVIVPLDGSPAASKVLPVVRTLAKAIGLRVLLVRVRHAVSMYSGGLGVDWLELDSEDENVALDYLNYQRERLTKSGIDSSTRLLEGGAADSIINLAKRTPHALVAMTTRGRSGTERTLLGSVADRVVSHSDAPVLLVRA